jgi:hypothetical protein
MLSEYSVKAGILLAMTDRKRLDAEHARAPNYLTVQDTIQSDNVANKSLVIVNISTEMYP